VPPFATFLKERAEHQVLFFLTNTLRDKGIIRKVSGWKVLSTNFSH